MSHTVVFPRLLGETHQAVVAIVAFVVAAVMATGFAAPLPDAVGNGASWLRSDPPAQGTVPATASPSAPSLKIDSALDPGATTSQAVIVRAFAGSVEAARAAVVEAGGTVGELLPMIDGFAADVPGSALAALEASTAIVAVTADREIQFEEFSYDDTTTASSFAKTSGATSAWATGNLGQGVGVAVIDTGVSPVNDLKPRVAYGPDLSGEGSIVDTYGHGTVMAGIIAGSGADSAGNAGGAYTGVAPKAHVVSVKAAGRNGAVDVSTMLQAMHWVSAYRDQFNIRVLNVAWGTRATQSPELDPLNYAVQRLWKLGIVVVVAAGNSGPNAGTITKPGDDPMVITVGAFNDKQNVDPSDDALAAWSSRGPTPTGLTKPDVVAPGRTLVTTRSFGSDVEKNNPKALIAPSYIKGSGSSQAAAVTSGLAALMIKANPALTPDQVKALLAGTASPLAGVSASQQGAGRVRLAAALAAVPGPAAWQSSTATGMGLIESSRGGMNLETDCGGDGVIDVIKGEIDIRCEKWDPGPWTGGAWTGGAWTGGAWTGGAWTGGAWTGGAWTGSTWTGGAWTGGAWTTAEYEETLFLSLFWGDKPEKIKGKLKIPGEVHEVPDHARYGR